MSKGFGFETPPAFDPQLWSQPRWLPGTPMLETAHALARAGLGEVIDEGDGLAGWRPCPQRSVIVILSGDLHAAMFRLESLFLSRDKITVRIASFEVGNWVRFQIIPDAPRPESVHRVRGLDIVAYWDWCNRYPPDPELLTALRYRTVWAGEKRVEPSSAIAPTLPDEACERQTQFGGAARRGDPSDHQLDAMAFANPTRHRLGPSLAPPPAPLTQYETGLIERLREDAARLMALPPRLLSKGEPDA